MGLIRRGVRIGVVSDAPRKQAWLRLFDAGLERYFDTVIAFDDTGVQKPNPQPFLLAMERLGVTAAETIMVGDWPERDMRGAAALGVITVFAKYGDVHNVEHSGADYEIAYPMELLALTDRIGVTRPHPSELGQLNLPWEARHEN